MKTTSSSAATIIVMLLLLLPPAAISIYLEPVIDIPGQGKVQGLNWVSRQKRDFYAFLSIPYAAPPIGDLRFARPIPASSWRGVRTVRENETSVCSQMNFQEILLGQEDCLHLHVYTTLNLPSPPNNTNEKKAVMVWIHGGGFFAGSSNPDNYGPEFFMDHNVVMVCVNYRLGPLGFLTLENDLAPGNLGLRDIILALKWVQTNIGLFGGDKNKVTIFGESAGSMAVFYLMVSPAAKGLFHGIIGQSGPFISSYNNWDKRPGLYGLRFAEQFNCTSRESIDYRDNSLGRSNSLLKCLRDIKPMDLVQQMTVFFHYPWTGPCVWKPYFDGHFISDPLFPREPYKLLEDGQYNKVPVVMGTNKDEGILNIIGYIKGVSKLTEVDMRWDSLGPLILFHRSLDETTSEDVYMARAIKKHYFGRDGKIEQDTLKKFINLMGDHTFYGGIEAMIQLMLPRHSPYPIYHYMFDHQATFTVAEGLLVPEWRLIMKWTARYIGLELFDDQWLGVGHGDELPLLFKQHYIPYDLLLMPKDQVVSKRMLTYWTNFAKYHSPNGLEAGNSSGRADLLAQWIPLSNTYRAYMNISTNHLNMDNDESIRARSHLWCDIIRRVRHYRGYLSDKMPLYGREVPIWLKSQYELTIPAWKNDVPKMLNASAPQQPPKK